jgi:hypothetical protein
MKSIKQLRESNLEEASVQLDNPFDSKHGPDHKSETKHADMMKKNHGVTTKYHRDSGEMSYHGPKKNLKAALHTHYQTDNENDIKDNHPDLYEDVSKKKSSDMARVNAGAMSKSEFDSKWKKPAKKSLAGPGGLYKNLVKEENVEESSGHESTLAAKATAAAARNPSKELHLKAMEAHKNAQGFFKGQAHDYHLNKAIEHAKKASEMKEGAEEDMAKHHAAAQAAKAAGDNDAFHKHMDAKFEVAKKRDAENAKKPVAKLGETLTKSNTAGDFIHDFVHSKDPKFAGKSPEERKKMALGAYYAKQNEDLENACWKGYEAIGMKMKNGRKVPNCVPKEGVNEGTEESLDESVHSVKAAKFSQKAKLKPSISTHVRASDAHAKAASSYEKKIAAHIKAGGESSELKPLESMAKHHNRSSTLHKFMAHRLVKQGLKEAVEMEAEAADDKLNLKITRHSQLAVNAGKRGDTAAQKFHLDMVSKLKAGEGAVKEGTEYDDQEEVIMAKGQLLKIADMAKDLADSMDDQDELEAWIQVKITTAYDQMDDVHSYVEYTQDLYDDQPEAEKEYATEQVNEDVAANNDAKELARMQMLVRLGLLDRLKLNTVTRAIKKLDNSTPVTTIAEKDVLFELLQNLIAAITSDESIFKKVKFNVANK